MNKMLFGVFSDLSDANTALERLQEEGFDRDEVSVIVQESVAKERLGDADANVTVADEAAEGAVTGGVLGALVGFLTGIGAIAIPGLGAILIGGPIAAALGLTGAAATTVSGAVTGALAGGLVGALVGLGVPEEEAKMYEDRIKKGDALVVVAADTEDERQAAEAVMKTHGAESINYYTAS